MNLIRYLWCCYRAYQSPGDIQYFSLSWRGVPCLAVVIARNREAWRVSTFAIEALRRIG
jgi:hypothetical protein